MKPIKFRQYDKKEKIMLSWEYLKARFPLSILDSDVEKCGFSPFMQFTGMKDWDGEDIYEGDIIELELDSGEKAIVEVVYESLDGQFALKKGNMIYMANNDDLHEGKIIGNIYENPELLETP